MPKNTCQTFCRAEIDRVQSFFSIEIEKKIDYFDFGKKRNKLRFLTAKGYAEFDRSGLNQFRINLKLILNQYKIFIRPR